MEKRRDLFPRLAQGASFFFLAACLSVTYECVQIHNLKADQPDTPLADATLQPAPGDPVPSTATGAPPPPPRPPEDNSFGSLIGSIFGGEEKKTKPEAKAPDPVKVATATPAPTPPPAAPPATDESAIATHKTKPLDFNFLADTKPEGIQTFEVTQRIVGNKVNYSINLNPGWGEQSRTLVDKSFYHEKGINLFIFAEPPDSSKAIKAEKYQENYAQQEVDKIAATHPSLFPFHFEQDVRSFRHRHWGSFRFVHNGITKLVLYTHAGKNGKYSMIISSQHDLLSEDMKKIWLNAAETFEVDLDAKPPAEETK